MPVQYIVDRVSGPHGVEKRESPGNRKEEVPIWMVLRSSIISTVAGARFPNYAYEGAFATSFFS